MLPEPIEGSVAEYFERSAAEFPNRIAVRDGSREITYQELNRRANQLAREILAHNPGNAPIPVYLGYDISAVTAILGIIKTGCPFVVLDPSFPVERNQLILSSLDARLLITDTGIRPRRNLARPLPSTQFSLIWMVFHPAWMAKISGSVSHRRRFAASYSHPVPPALPRE